MDISTPIKQPPEIKSIISAVAPDFTNLNQVISDTINSDLPLIQAILQHIFQAGGKRLRPLIVLLFANHFGRAQMTQQIELAAIIEFVHTATLLHDDVVDHSSLRRGRDTANAKWGNQSTILVGDFLYARAFELLANHSNPAIMQQLAKTTQLLATGELMQLAQQRQLISEATYLDTIYRKTAALFEASGLCASLLAQQNQSTQQACALFGKHLGIIFQIMDDILDYTADTTALGKQVGDDLAEGKMTLPLIYAYEELNMTDKAIVRQALSQPNTAFAPILDLIHKTDAIGRCQSVVTHHAHLATEALHTLQPSIYQQQLHHLLQFSLQRSY